ncbi:hypothetical protein CTAYLR_006971 [Chrysophaeum taylorii]|uniref:L,D-TPase catalytic domain-containing protein n=1 Tax=Chrysophaeum taylorii TaxID=2483200 RepID=A0AAD7XPB1_9STRA|nr:hypothetical protein CTAYLR_006971 [Chrysophaeum taylorii]
MPLPWTRVLKYFPDALESGSDVAIAQALLGRALNESVVVDSVFGPASAVAVAAFRGDGNGTFDAPTANALLACCSDDRYAGGTSPSNRTTLYTIVVPVVHNRSVELNATLFGPDGELLSFRARTHGLRDDALERPWPDYSNDDGLNEFTADGNTPTGLATLDLNTPEPNASLYGPYPVNRVVTGLEGNSFLVLGAGGRSGILLHSGLWPPGHGTQMPNSDGCIHVVPEDADRIWQALVSIGAQVRPNPYTSANYPYTPQGLISVIDIETR